MHCSGDHATLRRKRYSDEGQFVVTSVHSIVEVATLFRSNSTLCAEVGNFKAHFRGDVPRLALGVWCAITLRDQVVGEVRVVVVIGRLLGRHHTPSERRGKKAKGKGRGRPFKLDRPAFRGFGRETKSLARR